jgi:hypothetical protein
VELTEAAGGASRNSCWGNALQSIKHGEVERVAGRMGGTFVGCLFGM